MKVLITLYILLISSLVFGQNGYYSPPVKIPLLLSGSFAELRGNHFHSGIDIKTQGVTGIPVYSSAEGFISRIVVSPGGYGRALYVNHPNGTTTVYGHLQRFRKDIESYVREQQYNSKAFRIDMQIVPGKFPLQKDDYIADSGNSGSSGGPHLHFEIRDTQSEFPLNPLDFNFPVEDNIPPKIFSLMIVPLSDTSHVNYASEKRSYPLVYFEGKYHIKNNPVIPVYGPIGFAIRTNDYLDGAWNKCGIISMQLTINDELYFSHQLKQFSFDESRYINSHIDYETYINKRQRYQKTWVEPGNKLSTYNYVKGDGSFSVVNKHPYKIQILLKDSYGNSSILEFFTENKYKETIKEEEEFKKEFVYNESNQFKTEDIQLDIPKGTLYKNLKFKYKTMPIPPGYFSEIHVIHKNTVPLHKSMDIKVRAKSIPPGLESKALLVNIDDMSGDPRPAGGKYQFGWMNSKVRSFGHYAVALDTIPPSITPLSITNSTTLKESNRIRFKISDNLSGIKLIEGTLNGEWILLEYDPKKSLITHTFDKERFEFNKRHYFKLIVSDYQQNETMYEATFWK